MLWSSSLHKEAYKQKGLKCAGLAADAEQRGWEAEVCPVGVGCRGIMGKTTTGLGGGHIWDTGCCR